MSSEKSNKTLGPVLAAALAATTFAGDVLAQEPVSNQGQEGQTQAVQINTNRLNISKSTWDTMKIVVDEIKRNPKSQKIYGKTVNKNGKESYGINREFVHTGGIPKKYWELSNRKPPEAKSHGEEQPVAFNIETLKDYVRLLAQKKAQTFIHLGVIGDRNRIYKVAEAVQGEIDFNKEHYKDTAPFIGGIFRVVPSEGDKKSLTSKQQEEGILVFVRGELYGNIGDLKEAIESVREIWWHNLVSINNEELIELIEQGNKISQEKARNGSGDSTVKNPEALNLE
ncbi:MAG: hypothetical protein OEY94_03095 [Alphaproteobacteria bacterium]|nr:hypothetical protein [Alphaproteobacteria bacterium]